MGLMTALFGIYEKPSANNKVQLVKKLFNLNMAKGIVMEKHLNEFNTITNQLSSMEIEFDDEIHALIVLASLPNSWEAMRIAVSNSARKGKLKYDDIRDLILREKVRRRDADIDNAEGQAFVTENKGRIEVHGIMIELCSVTGQSQLIDLSIRRLENVSIEEKRAT